MNTITNKDFTFQTFSEYCQETQVCSEFDYKCVRTRTTYKDGQTICAPVKTFEDYLNFIEGVTNNPNIESYEVTPLETFFEREFYL